MRVRRILTKLLLSLTAILAQASQADQVRLLLGQAHSSSFIGYYMAEQQGFYKKAGLSVEFIQPDSPLPNHTLLAQGQAEYAVGSADALLAVHRRAPVALLAAIGQSSPDVLLVADEYRSAEQLRGKKLTMSRPPDSLAVRLLLKRFAITTSHPNLPMFFSGREAFRLGQLDAISGSLLNDPLAGSSFSSLVPAEYGIHLYSGLLMAHKQEISRNPERVKRFLQASLKGWQYALEHPQESISLLQSQYAVPHSASFLSQQLHILHELINPNLIPLGQLNPERLNSIQKMLLEQGLIEQILPADRLIYNPQPQSIAELITPWLLPALTILLVMAAFIMRLLWLNKRLHQEIAERRQSEAHVRHLATHDSLTGLANRVALKEKLELLVSLARRNKQNPVVIFIDLDGFKDVNDRFGHNAGDDVLRQFAQRTQQRLRESDTFGRLAGDEFLVLLPDSGKQGFQSVTRKVQAALEAPFVIEGENIYLSVSMGIAVYRNHNETADQLLMRADHAMYDVKHNGKDNIVLAAPFSPQENQPLNAMQHAPHAATDLRHDQSGC